MPEATTLLLAIAVITTVAQFIAAPNKPKLPEYKAPEPQDRNLSQRQAIGIRRLVYGRGRYGGPMTFMHTTGSSKEYLHIVVTLAGHAWRSMDALMLDDEVVPLDGSGNATGKYAGYVYCRFGLGTTAGDADFNSALQSECPDKWTSAHRQAGCAKVYVRLKYSSDIFPGQIPNITVIGDGQALIRDPRQAGSPDLLTWTDNAALCIAHYLRHPTLGLGITAEELDDDALIAAANICDEIVARKSVSVGFTVDAAGLVTVSDKSAALRTGTTVRLSGTGSPDSDGLPAGYTAHTDYYWKPLGPLTGRLCTTLANARANVYVTPSAGSGTLRVTGEPRYTCNGEAMTDMSPGDIIGRMLTAMSGQAVYAGGEWKLYAGAWRAPSRTYGKADIDGSTISVDTRRPGRDVFNGVKGIFVNPDDNFQKTDFPAVRKGTASDYSDDTYLAEDQGERKWEDIDLAFTDSPSMAQRIGRILLERTRRQISTTWPLNLSGLLVQPPDTVGLTNAIWGWTAKSFEVETFQLEQRKDENDAPYYGTLLQMREIDANVFAWDETVDERTLTPSPTTDLPDPFTVAPPTGLALQSGTDVLGIREDGTVFSRILATWTAPADIFVTSGGQIEVEFRKSSGSPTEAWRPFGAVRGDQTRCFILDVDDGEAYDVRIRSRNGGTLAVSAWTEVLNHTVAGKSEPPSNVSGFAAQQNGNVVTFQWSQIPDVDLAGYEIRYATPGTFMWDSSTSLTAVTRGTRITTAAVPPGDWRFGIKARDTSGNYSATESTYDLEVVSANDVIQEEEQAPYWHGTKTSLIRHWSGVLVPESTKMANEHTSAELFEQFVPYPKSDCAYEAPIIDMGFDAMNVRVYAEHEAPLGRGLTTSSGDPELSIDYRSASGAFDGYEDWTIGTANLRYLKSRLSLDATQRRAYLSSFKPIVDAEERTVAFSFVGGTPILFSPQFNAIPSIQLTPQSDAGSPSQARYATYENASNTGFTPRVWNAAGNEVAGAAGSGTATGV